jgi:transposase
VLTATGIGETSALQILGELAVLPGTLDARQWVTFGGLDPRLFKSGKSVEKRPRISRGGSRHLGRALYMPALVARVAILIWRASINLGASRQSSSAGYRRSYAKTAARTVCDVPH